MMAMVRTQRAPRAALVAQRAQHDGERSFECFFVTHYERVVLIAYRVLVGWSAMGLEEDTVELSTAEA